nr:polyphosphate polymerase domain-containing protein [uncultured Lachnoclostridium sp.]
MGDLKFRHETKHYITYTDYLAIRSRLKVIASSDTHADENGFYLIRSLYFDNYNDKALKEKVYGYTNREKFRIRYYNGDDSFIHLEKKSKMNGLCNKLSASITKEQVEQIIAGNIEFLKESKQPLFIDLYTKMKEQCLKPRVIVDYLREPFIYNPGNVRITFDTKIKSGLYSKDFFNISVPTIDATDKGQLLMEVKYDAFLPELIQMAIQVNERPKTSFSKYEACRRFG